MFIEARWPVGRVPASESRYDPGFDPHKGCRVDQEDNIKSPEYLLIPRKRWKDDQRSETLNFIKTNKNVYKAVSLSTTALSTTVYFLNSVLRPFQDYFSSETGQSVGGAKTREPRDKPPDTPASRTWLVSHVARAGLDPHQTQR